MSDGGPESKGTSIRASGEVTRDLLRVREELGPRAPRVALFLVECSDAKSLRKTIDRIPEAAATWLEEIVVMQGGETPAAEAELLNRRGPDLRVHRQPRDPGFGGARKEALEYALQRNFDFALFLRGDGSQPPEELPRLLHPALCNEESMVIGSRLAGRRSRRGSPPHTCRRLAHSIVAGAQNRILGIRLHDYFSSYRLYASRLVRCIPFQLNADDRLFDIQMLIQCRALGVSAAEVPISDTWREETSTRREIALVAGAWASAVDYRLHQLHLTRRGRYLVDRGVHYTLKHSATGSHMQIVGAIAPGSRVLDLGCSQGLLARPLREKQVRVTGVDARPPHLVSEDLEDYHQRDLELPVELPTGRIFDYVVVADVIEHVRNRTQLLRSVRRYLKEDGRLLISTPNIALWFYRLSLLVGRFEYGPRGVLDWTHVHLYTRDTFRRELQRAGFRVTEERVTALPFEVVFESTGRSRAVRKMARLYHALARLWPKLFAYQIILEAEITSLDEEAAGGG